LTNNACFISSIFKFSRCPLTLLIIVVVAFDTESVGETIVPPLCGTFVCFILRIIISNKSPIDVSCTSSRTSALRMNSLISFPPRISAAKSFNGIC
jgi:hypothetical protein